MQEDVYQGAGLNLYAYCGNNPVVYYDPSGYECGDMGKTADGNGEKEKTTISDNTDNPTPNFIVTPDGTVMDTSKDYNLVSTQTPTNEGGEYFQIHNTHPHENIEGPHTHRPEVNTDPITGTTSSKRVTTPTSAADIDYADAALRDGTLRERKNRKDKGGP